MACSRKTEPSQNVAIKFYLVFISLIKQIIVYIAAVITALLYASKE